MKVKNIRILMIIALGCEAFFCLLTIVFTLAQKTIRLVQMGSDSFDDFFWPMDVLGIHFIRLLISALFFYVMNKQLNAKGRQRIITEIWCMIIFFLFPFFSQIAYIIQIRVLPDDYASIQIYYLLLDSINWVSIFTSAAYILLFITCTASICYKLAIPPAVQPVSMPESSWAQSIPSYTTLSLEPEESEDCEADL